MNKITIRTASPEDSAELARIYKYYVESTAISFETSAPTAEEFRRRIERTLKSYPYLVAQKDGAPIGYAYASAFIPRGACSHCAELSVYIDKDETHSGVGRQLYQALESALENMGVRNFYACIAIPDEEDKYLSFNSMRFHEHMGYSPVGVFRNSGYKFNRFYHLIWMEKLIGENSQI